MKLYLGKHRSCLKKQVSLEDIPLAYLCNEAEDRDIAITISPAFNQPATKVPLHPYQWFEDRPAYLFDRNENPVSAPDRFIRFDDTKNRWYVLPQETQEFYPCEFIYRILVRRTGVYTKSDTYPIRFCFDYDRQEPSQLSRCLASVVQNDNRQRKYPPNIQINGGNISYDSFQDMSEDRCDFLFKPANALTASKINEKLDQHINLWLYDDSFNGMIEGREDITDAAYTLREHAIFASMSGLVQADETDGIFYVFDPVKRWDILEDSDRYEYLDFFQVGSPLCLIHKKNGGYLILSHPSFLEHVNTADDTGSHLRLFLETILYVYLHSYYETDTKTSWITDEPIDFYLNTVQHYGLTHPRINMDRVLLEDGYDIDIPYEVIEIKTEPKNEADFTVSYLGQTRFHDLLFKKIGNTATKDPAKGNKLLIYTVRHSLLLYDPDAIELQLIETGVDVRDIDSQHIGVSVMKSSRYGICTREETVLAIPDNEDYVVYYDGTEERFRIEVAHTFAEMPGLVKVADVAVTLNRDIVYKDIRRLGGGEASAVPNYEMIDTGNRYGRPYRYGCPMIVKLPSRFKPMASEIRSEVEKHIASGDYPIIVYKD